MKIDNNKSKSMISTTIVAAMTIMMIAAISLATTPTNDNLFLIKYAFAQLQEQPIVGGPGGQTLTGDPNLPYPNQMYGDTATSLTNTRGGNDIMTGGTHSDNSMYGDAYDMKGASGGNDKMTGGSGNNYNEMYGDAYEMVDSRGGNDIMTGGTYSFNNMFGDAAIMTDSTGGNDIMTGGTYSFNNMIGDAAIMTDSTGGNDIMTGGGTGSANSIFGDGADEMFNSVGGDDTIIANGDRNGVYGDGRFMYNSQGGDDTITATAPDLTTDPKNRNELFGDAWLLADNSVGGDDTIIADGDRAMIFGDAGFNIVDENGDIIFPGGMIDSRGGDDTITATGDGNSLVGDAGFMSNSVGGDDTITATGDGNTLYGEGFEMVDSTGGNDILTSIDGSNYLVGDAEYMYGKSEGGDDTLISGLGTDTMYGDAYEMDSTATGGNDILNAAKGGINGGADILYGDDFTQTGIGGADLFIIGGNTLATAVDYDAAEGDRIVGNTNQQEQISGQLNAILLKGK